MYMAPNGSNVGSCTHDSDGVVEEGLPEDDDVEDLVDVDLLEDGEDGDLE